MGIANFPFPSFTFVLTSEWVIIPGPSYVIRLAPVGVLHPHTPQTATLTTSVNPNDEVVEENYPLANLNLENDSIVDISLGHSEPEKLVDDITEIMSMYDTRTVRGQNDGNEVSFLKTSRFRFKNIFKRLAMVRTY